MLDNLAARAAYAVFRILGHFPLALLQSLGLFFGWVGWLAPGSYKLRAQENFSIAFPGLGRSMQRQAMEQLLQMFFELPYLWARQNDAQMDAIVHCDEWPMFESLLAEGKGMILITPHVGCFEVLGPLFSRKYKSTVIFKEPKMRWLKVLINRVRVSSNLSMVPATHGGVKALIKTLRRGNTVGMLPDQVPNEGDGVYAPFFGRPAYTMTLVQKLQHYSGAPVVTVGIERLGLGRGYRFHATRMPEAMSADPVIAATQMNQALEDMIRKMPLQYLWGYNRYRKPRPAHPADRPAAGH